ncbi:hypothetical protein [Citromicrobium bathyomarinum]|uniref:hypothetical protein n=2 Tax=Citromicrobium TaxID=72173 RepID=UPI0001DD0A21|nr:hypothetical protein WG74_06110 [Citromicrobium sp. JL477]
MEPGCNIVAARNLYGGSLNQMAEALLSNESEETEEAIRMVASSAAEIGCLLPRGDLTHAAAYHILTPQVLQFPFLTAYEPEPRCGFTIGYEATSDD